MTSLTYATDCRDGFVVLDELIACNVRALLVIPTNLQLRRDGAAVMGAGMALAAARRDPTLPLRYGCCLRQHAPVHALWPYLLLPTKDHWLDCASPALIAAGLARIPAIVDYSDIARVLLPRIGCGLGRLRWERDVLPLVDFHLAPIAERLVLVGA